MSIDPKRLQTIEEIFNRVVELSPPERAPVLDEACAGDADLRWQVESLLEHDGPASAQLHITQSLQALAPPETTDPNIGRRIDAYEIRRRLGSGGMGNVYLAVQIEHVERTVAIKFIRRGIDTEETIRRFAHERQVLAALHHPNIAQFYDAGSTDDGLPYFIMEYVQGEPITHYCDGHRLTLIDRLKLFQRVCGTVHFAHQNEVIHRDLKPSNILVTPAGEPKLLDFGIAKIIQHQQGDETSCHTVTGQRYLTPDYASPEQIRGDKMTTASDVYALGILLYELLTGHRPYERQVASDSALKQDVDVRPDPPGPSERVRRMMVHSRQIAPSSSSMEAIAARRGARPDQLHRQLRGELDSIILMALRSEPQERYGSAAQFAEDIGRYLDYRPVHAAPPGVVYRLRKFAGRHKTVTALLVLLALAMVGTLYGAVLAYRFGHLARVAERTAQTAAASEHRQVELLRRAAYSQEMALAGIDLRNAATFSLKRRLMFVPEDLRRWEWGYLNARSDQSNGVMHLGRGVIVYALAFDPTGRWLVSGSDDKSVRLWDITARKQLRVLGSHPDRVVAVDFATDGQRIMSASVDGTVKLWRVDSPDDSTTFDLGMRLASARISPDGAVIAAGLRDRTIRLLDARNGTEIRRLTGFVPSSVCLAFSPDGGRIGAAGKDNTVIVWDTKSGEVLFRSPRYAAPVCSVAFSRDGRFLVNGTCDRNRSVQVWKTDTWSLVTTSPEENTRGAARCVAFCAGGGYVASSWDGDCALRLWPIQVHAKKPGRFLLGHELNPISIAVGPDDHCIATGGSEGSIRVWNSALHDADVMLKWQNGLATGLAYSPDRRLLLCSEAGSSLRIWDADTHRELLHHPIKDDPQSCVAFAPSGEYYASGSSRGNLRLYDAATSDLLRILPAHEGQVFAVTFTPDSKMLVSAGEEGLAKMWEVATTRLVHTFQGHAGAVRCVAVHPNGLYVLTGGKDGTLRDWYTGPGTAGPITFGNEHELKAIAVTRAGERIAAAGSDGIIRIINAGNGGLLLQLLAPPSPVCGLAFSPDGDRLAVCSEDGTLRVWDPITGVQVLALEEDSPLTCVAFSPDGRELACGSRQHIAIKSPVAVAQRPKVEQEWESWNRQAKMLLARLTEHLCGWNSLYQAIRDDRDLEEPLRRQALNRLLVAASECPGLITPWEIDFFSWQPTNDFQELSRRWREASEGPGIAQVKDCRIHFDWKDQAPVPGIPKDHFGMVARAKVKTAAGRHAIRVQSDDGARVWIDDRLVFDDWKVHVAAARQVVTELTEGEHAVRVEYFQLTGGASLQFSLRAAPAIPGSQPASRNAD